MDASTSAATAAAAATAASAAGSSGAAHPVLLGSTLTVLQQCGPGASAFIEEHFHDCIYTSRDLLSFSLGLASIALWVVAQLPQFINNFKNQSAEALSVWFLAEWFLGDTLNLLGCLIQGQQLPTTTLLAGYFVLSDMFMLIQYIYYGALKKRQEKLLRLKLQSSKSRRHAHGHHHHHHAQGSQGQGREPSRGHGRRHNSSAAVGASGDQLQLQQALLQPQQHEDQLGEQHHTLQVQPEVPSTGSDGRGEGGVGGANERHGTATTVLAGASAATSFLSLATSALTKGSLILRHGSTNGASAAGGASWGIASAWTAVGLRGSTSVRRRLMAVPDASDIALVAGTIMGYVSSMFYIASRVSQILKNKHRRSTEGLAISMFCFTVSANLCTGFAILLRLHSLTQLQDQLPWLCGTFGTVSLDIILLLQYKKYGAGPPAVSEHAGGLPGTPPRSPADLSTHLTLGTRDSLAGAGSRKESGGASGGGSRAASKSARRGQSAVGLSPLLTPDGSVAGDRAVPLLSEGEEP